MVRATMFLPDTIAVFILEFKDGSRVQDNCRVYQSFGNGNYMPIFQRNSHADLMSYKLIGRLTNIKKK